MPKPAVARVVGFWPLTGGSAWVSESFTSARTGSPSGWKSLYVQVSDVHAPLKTVLPQPNVMNGGSAVGVPAVALDGTSIASSSSAVASRTLIVYGGNVWSNSRLSSILRGWPPPNSSLGADCPVTSLGFQVLVLAIEYSVGLK